MSVANEAQNQMKTSHLFSDWSHKLMFIFTKLQGHLYTMQVVFITLEAAMQ